MRIDKEWIRRNFGRPACWKDTGGRPSAADGLPGIPKIVVLGVMLLGLGAVADAGGIAAADTIKVLNPNFTSSSVAPGHYNSSRVVAPGKDKIISDWGIGSTGGYAAAGIHNNGGTPVQYVAYTDYPATVIYQDVGTLQPNRHYQLSVLVRENSGRWGAGSTSQIALVNTQADANAKTQTYKGRLLAKARMVVRNPGVVLSTSVTIGKNVSGDLTIELSLAKRGTSAKTGSEVQFTNVWLTCTPAKKHGVVPLKAG